jgi:hypothetical protein
VRPRLSLETYRIATSQIYWEMKKFELLRLLISEVVAGPLSATGNAIIGNLVTHPKAEPAKTPSIAMQYDGYLERSVYRCRNGSKNASFGRGL